MGRIKNTASVLWNLSPKRIWKYICGGSISGIKLNLYRKLLKLPPKKEAEMLFYGRKLHIADASSFIYMHREIFINGLYKFNSASSAPFIIDCGTNIGLSVIYFKLLFPNARIIAFEPDPFIFGILEKNIKSFGLGEVALYPLGIGQREELGYFLSDKSDGGRFVLNEAPGTSPVKIVPLSQYMQGAIDFLKIDIEGNETEALEEIKDKLTLVKNLFIEYHSYKGKEQELDKLLEILRIAGFRYEIQSVFNRKSPFIPFKSGGLMDMQLNICAVRE